VIRIAGPAPARVALVHDWLIGMRGGERCLESILELLPGAPIHTLFHRPGSVSPAIEAHPIRASVLSRLPAARRRHRLLMPLFPWAMAQFDTRGADLVLSLSHCAAKAAPKGAAARHLSYCFTPARYLWDLEDEYIANVTWWQRLGARAWFDELRAWDRATAAGVDRFIAISAHVAARIARIYGREAEVIHPPVDVERFRTAPPREVGDAYLIVSALVEYKGVDAAIRAFAADRSRRLRIIGGGPMAARWRALSRELGAENVEWLGHADDAAVAREMARCRAFLLPCEEDFGITPVEAMAAGRPVVALGRGGALETVVAPGGESPATGVLFAEPSPEAILDALDRIERELDRFDPAALREHARRFDRPVFRAKFARALAEEGVEVPAEGEERGAPRAAARARPAPRPPVAEPAREVTGTSARIVGQSGSP
jgi:glycosyltransferase involved in cell wall biosynthesis